MSDVDISVLLCTYNRAQILEDALESLVAQVLPNEIRFEIVVVDNNSTDPTRTVIQKFAGESDVPIRYVFEPSAGIAQARNRSLLEARGQWFAFIDDDELVEVTPKSLRLRKVYLRTEERRMAEKRANAAS